MLCVCICNNIQRKRAYKLEGEAWRILRDSSLEQLGGEKGEEKLI